MDLAFFMNTARLFLVHPSFMHSFCHAVSFVFWSVVRFRLARFMQLALLFEACMSLLQQPFPPAKDVPATNIPAANTAKLVLIMSMR